MRVVNERWVGWLWWFRSRKRQALVDGSEMPVRTPGGLKSRRFRLSPGDVVPREKRPWRMLKKNLWPQILLWTKENKQTNDPKDLSDWSPRDLCLGYPGQKAGWCQDSQLLKTLLLIGCRILGSSEFSTRWQKSFPAGWWDTGRRELPSCFFVSVFSTTLLANVLFSSLLVDFFVLQKDWGSEVNRWSFWCLRGDSAELPGAELWRWRSSGLGVTDAGSWANGGRKGRKGSCWVYLWREFSKSYKRTLGFRGLESW